MGCFSGCTRIILAILNFLLLLAFLAIGIMGLLLRFNKQVIDDILHKAATKWSTEETERFATAIMNYGASFSLFLIIVGFLVAFTALLGLISLCCKAKCVAGIYITILALLSCTELGFIIYAFAVPGNMYYIADTFLNKSLAHIGQGDSLGNASLELFNQLGSDGGNFCCGMWGIGDFEGLKVKTLIPSSCCLMNYTQVTNGTAKYNCTYGAGKLVSVLTKVPGCDAKVHEWIDEHTPVIVGVPCGLVGFQLLVLAVTICLCARWTRDRY